MSIKPDNVAFAGIFHHPVGDRAYIQSGGQMTEGIPGGKDFGGNHIAPNGETYNLVADDSTPDGWWSAQNFGEYNYEISHQSNVNAARYHTGEDWNNNAGDDAGKPVYVAANGLVVRVGHDGVGEYGKAFGNYVVIKHWLSNGDVVYSVYAHLQSIDASVNTTTTGDFTGSSVTIDQKIGLIGHTGAAGGLDHLHFEMYSGELATVGTILDEHGYSSTARPSGWVDPTDFINSHRNASASQFAPPAFVLSAFAPNAGGWDTNDHYPRMLADVNHDGMADIVGFGEAGVSVALATGGGAFGPYTFKLSAFAPAAGGWNSNDHYPRMLADVNHDGMADIVGFGEAGVSVALATGGGSFGPYTFKLAAFAPAAGGWNSNDHYPREMADVNGDGMADIVGFGEAGVSVALATGGGSFGPYTFKLAAFAPAAGGWDSNNHYPRELADVNGDSMADIVGFGEQGVWVALASGGGSFRSPTFNFTGFAPSSGGWNTNDHYPRELADVNGDGKIDIVGFGEAGVLVAYGNGDGTFQPGDLKLQAFAPAAGGWTSNNTYPRYVADINHDGAADIVGFGSEGVLTSLSNGFHLI